MDSLSQSEKDLKYYIMEMENIPNSVILTSGILPEELEDDHKTMLNKERKKYADIVGWLRYYLLNEKERESYLESRCANYQPFAQLIVSRLKLIEEIFKRIPLLQIKFSSPIEYCFKSQWEICQRTFHEIGLLDNPIITGKRDAIDTYTKKLQEFADKPFPLKFQLTNNESTEKYATEYRITKLTPNTIQKSPFKDIFNKYIFNQKEAEYILLNFNLNKKYVSNILIFASFISQVDFDFRNNIFPKYIKIHKRCWREIRKNQNLASIYIKEDGNLLTG